MGSDGKQEYVLYLRKSRGRAGIARQRTVTTTYIERSGGAIAGEFADVDRTAYAAVGKGRPDRQGFDAMLAYLASRPGLGIAAWHADRLLRNPGDTELLIAACVAGGHLVETPRGGSYDLSNATGRKRLRADANDATFEVDHMTERITAEKMEAASEGRWLGGPVPFGWQKDLTGALVISEPAARAVRAATLAVPSGTSMHQLARDWTAAGLTRRGGKPWTPVEVRRVLLRARNAGLHVHQEKVTGVTGQWPAIVTEAEWGACRGVLLDKARRTSTGQERRWLGSGLFLCGVCGSTLLVTLISKDGRKRKVYRCRNRKHIARDAVSLDEYVKQVVLAWVTDQDRAALIPAADTSRLRTELDAVRAEMKDLADLKNEGKLTLAQVVTMNPALLEREASIEARLAVAAAPSPLAPFSDGDAETVWDGLDLGQKRRVVSSLMTVTVKPVPRGRPKGHKPGESYFQPGYIGLDPVRPRGAGT